MATFLSKLYFRKSDIAKDGEAEILALGHLCLDKFMKNSLSSYEIQATKILIFLNTFCIKQQMPLPFDVVLNEFSAAMYFEEEAAMLLVVKPKAF